MKVLLVDDELYILEYIKHLIDWKSFGFKDVLVESTSDSALERLKKEHIDLVVSDVRMPGKSGIDLLQEISEEALDTKVVFLTGHSEFEYARAGIQFGLFDYLLKPITKESFIQMIVRFIQSVKNDKNLESEEMKFLFQSLVYEASQIESQIFFDSINTPKLFYIKKNKLDHKKESESLSWRIKKSSSLKVGEAHEVSNEFNTEQEMRVVFFEFFCGFSFNKVQFLKLKSAILKQLTDYDQQACLNFYMTLSNHADKVYFIVFLVYKLYQTQVYVNPEIVSILTEPDKCIDIIKNSMTKKAEALSDDATKKIVIKKLHQHIKKNLQNSLSLEELSEIVYLHPVYLSKLYKQETGTNLSSYILNKRLEKAAELLVESQLMVSDIGKMVGYRTSQYFIKMFKEKYKLTPQQFRRQKLCME